MKIGEMRLSFTQLLISSILFMAVVLEALRYMPGMIYIAALSLTPLIYGIKNPRYSHLFPIILATAYIPLGFFYTLEFQDILRMSLIWPLFFVVYSILSYPDSKDLEKRAIMVSLMASTISVISIVGSLSIAISLENPVILAIFAVLAGLSMIYITVDKGF